MVGVMSLLQLLTSSVMKFLVECYQKKVTDFAQKRHVKLTSTVMELCIPCHTLVKVVDAEDKAIEKFRTLDPPLK